MENPAPKFILVLVMLCAITGCVKLALRVTPSLVPNFSRAFFEECDPVLARESLPAELKLMEGLLKNAPDNRQLLTALCMGFAGYAMLFVEEEEPDRASLLYLRARDYGFRALGWIRPLQEKTGWSSDIIRGRLAILGKTHLQALFWTTMSWNAWLSLNLDKPVALTQLNIAQDCLKKVLDIDPDYFYGTPYILMGTILAAMPTSLGGDTTAAQRYFQKALEISREKFFLAHYYYARHYAVRTQNKELFLRLLREVKRTPSDELKNVCLINSAIKLKARRLEEMEEELFL